MSRLSEIIENHKNLDDLLSIFKHYGLNAQFVAASVVEQIDQTAGQTPHDGTPTAAGTEPYPPDLIEDLKQYFARL
ncbi:hypothetical protein [Paenibacillus oceani]|uniref:Uncharacterized protein n=1 Tax=Paenibacillus oceani TaxID=2772510 RepID=A0A927C9Z3_9BACL|nr:hypothetical protein [Paenibacillus oceani]MBD2862181.1 hypothetical protein [Paenibacillus oceani]